MRPTHLPAGTSFEIVTDDMGIPPWALQESAKLLESKVDRRIHQFALGRLAARKALKSLGQTTQGLVARLDSGIPDWPAGLVGSISHTAGAAICLTAKATDWSSLGVDIENLGRDISPQIVERIATKNERDWISASPAEQTTRTLQLFTAKEAYYKAIFPILKRRVGFKEVSFSWHAEDSRFSVLAGPVDEPNLSGIWVENLENFVVAYCGVGSGGTP